MFDCKYLNKPVDIIHYVKHFLNSVDESTVIQNTDVCLKVSKGAKIRNRYNQAPNLSQDTNGKVTN